MTTEQLTWNEAILKVLECAKVPLHYNDITDKIEKDKLRPVSGATPNGTVNRFLGLLRDDKKVVQTGRGLYALPNIAKGAEDEQFAEERDDEKKYDNPEILTVKAYGLHWDRNLIDWNKKHPELWGRQTETATLVNFADQVGIYLLYSWNEIVYVGKTNPRKGDKGLYNRLNEHNGHREKRSRWNSFSWFGFRPVNRDGSLGESVIQPELNDVIGLLENILIEALMPRLNMQAGDGTENMRKHGLYFQASVRNENRAIR